MSRGYRLVIFAAFGWLSLGGQSPSNERISGQSPAPTEQTGSPAQNGSTNPSPIVVTIVEPAGQAEAANAREAESRKHDVQELDAQIRAADATEKQILPSWLGAIFSFAGTCLIVWTLFETRKSINLDNPPLLRVTNVAIWEAGETRNTPPTLKPGSEICGRLYVVNTGRDSATVKEVDDNISSQCVATWHKGPLPMIRPFDSPSREQNPLKKTHFKSGQYTEWPFSITVPAEGLDGESLYVMGKLTYWGSSQNRRCTVFCRKYCQVTRRFVAEADNSDYEAEE